MNTYYTYDQYTELPGNFRIYYKLKDGGNGFNSIVLEATSFVKYQEWDEDVEFMEVCTVDAHFDGIRHINIGEEGYLHCIDLENWIGIFKELQNMESKYCIDIFRHNS